MVSDARSRPGNCEIPRLPKHSGLAIPSCINLDIPTYPSLSWLQQCPAASWKSGCSAAMALARESSDNRTPVSRPKCGVLDTRQDKPVPNACVPSSRVSRSKEMLP